MKRISLVLFLAASVAASAQTSSKPAAQTAKPATAAQAAKPAVTAHATMTAGKLPVIHGVIKTAFSLRYEDYKIGTGPLAEPNKVYHVLYSGYLASTGQQFDSTADHRMPVMKDGKPEMGPDGKPVLGEPQPLIFPQGYGRLIPGFDQGFAGMHVGGKRRIFVPWQLGYGMRDIPARGDHPGIPPKSDLIFDVELLEVTDMPKPPERPMGVPPHPGAVPGHPGAMPAAPAKPGTQAEPAKPAAAPAPATPHAETAPAAPAQPAAAAKPGTPAKTAVPASSTTTQSQPK